MPIRSRLKQCPEQTRRERDKEGKAFRRILKFGRDSPRRRRRDGAQEKTESSERDPKLDKHGPRTVSLLYGPL